MLMAHTGQVEGAAGGGRGLCLRLRRGSGGGGVGGGRLLDGGRVLAAGRERPPGDRRLILEHACTAVARAFPGSPCQHGVEGRVVKPVTPGGLGRWERRSTNQDSNPSIETARRTGSECRSRGPRGRQEGATSLSSPGRDGWMPAILWMASHPRGA